MTLDEAREAFHKASAELYDGKIDVEEWRSAWRSLEAAGAIEARIYPCATEGCTVMRSKAEGGNIFTVCDKHWDEAAEKPDHMKLCHELLPYVCCSCGKQTCYKHGLPLAEEHQGKWDVTTTTPRRCIPCADAGR